MHYDALARGIILRCQSIICGASVDKQALVRGGGIHIYPVSGRTKSVHMQGWDNAEACEENGEPSLIRRE